MDCNLFSIFIVVSKDTPSTSNSPRQTRSNRSRNKNETPIRSSNSEIVITDNAVDEIPHLQLNNSDIQVISLENSHVNLSTLNSDMSIIHHSPSINQMNTFTVRTPSPSALDHRSISIIESGNSNSSTASSSSSNSLLVKRPRKPMTSTSTAKPSLRSSNSGKVPFRDSIG